MLLTSDGRVKLADLGVAAQLGNSMSKRGTMIGTPHWMAPETVGQNEQYDFKVDIWGVAITAIELAQLAPPFADTKSVFKVRAHAVPMPCPCRAHAACGHVHVRVHVPPLLQRVFKVGRMPCTSYIPHAHHCR